jgi:hypothetical protein
VAYVNGVEVAHRLAPGRDGNNDPLDWKSRATGNHDDSLAVDFESIDITQFRNAFVQGAENVLAIHGLNNGASSGDLLIQPELIATRSADALSGPDDGALMLNEVAPTLEAQFWLELANDSPQPLELGGVVIVATGGDGGEYVLPDRTLVAGELLLLSEQDLGFHPDDNDKLFVYSANKQELLDARVVTNSLRGRAKEHPGRWLWPNVATPGTPNSFDLEDQIVINEIMFHPDQPAGEAEAEWIELYNRGDEPVDLSLWRLDDAVDFIFPQDTEIARGEYLVIARDAVSLAIEHPGINIVGNFTGTLSNAGEQLSLRDALGNPVDEVRYYDGGRWPGTADGTGPSIELRHPDVDNALAEAWAASDEGSKTTWQTYTYRGTAQASRVGPDNQWREFVIGLLDGGEVLIDDISVIENPAPDGTGRQMLRNGSFESGTSDWRLRGNHRHSGVIDDPDKAGNNVLRLTATGPTEHMHNHLETTLVDYIRNGRPYEISFRAKWISGSNQFHSRLYFNRLPMTTPIERPPLSGTPGARNSTAEPNIGPLYDGFTHSPAVPPPQQPVVVRVRAEDPDNVASMTLWYSVNGGGWTSQGMSDLGNGLYSGSIPGHRAATIVQFYVEGRDGLGASSTFPAAGRDSRALYKVDDGLASSTGLHNIRLIVTPPDRTFMHTDINLMSNDRIGTTLIYDEQEIFYDVGMRLKGSEHGRTTSLRLGFNVKFNPDQLFRGVLSGMSLDRSQGVGFGQREILNDIMATHSGSIPGEFNDLAHIMAPLDIHTSGAIMQMARFSDVFLDEQFDSGSDGNVFEYELIYYPHQTAAESVYCDSSGGVNKCPQPDGTAFTNIRSLGDDPESYRWIYLKKNNRDEDDYSRLIEFTKVMGLTGSAFNNQIGDVIDIDQFLRAHAIATLTGMSDNYTLGAQHNAQFYIRPSDGRVLYFPHDIDAFYSDTRNIGGGDWAKLISVNSRARTYYGHLHDIISTTWNRDHMQRWTEHFAQLLPGESWSSYLSGIGSRSANVLSQVKSRVPEVTFAITTGGGDDLEVDTASVVLQGDGWINVREIRLAGSDRPLLVEWTDRDSWRVDVPLSFGENLLTLEAYDFQGELIASESITVRSTAGDTRVADALRITELMFNPAQLPGGASFNNDDFEFIELKNISSSKTISLEGVSFDNGVEFDFTGSNVTNLAPGAFVLVVQNTNAFLSRYSGIDHLIAGQYTPDNLRNGGERVGLVDQFGQAIHNFRYDNDWYDGIKGEGFSLTVRDATAEVSLWEAREGWRPSSLIGGSPGADEPLLAPDPGDLVINEILTHSDTVGGDWIELHNTTELTTNRTINVGGWLLSDDELVLDKFQIPEGTSLAPGEFLLLTEETQFGNALHSGTRVPFGFSELGEQIIVTAALPDGTPLGFREDKTFGAAANGVTFGRHVKSTGGSDFTAMARPTPEADNSLPLVGPIVIHEIFYEPLNDREEFVELKNVGNATVPLFDLAAPENTWQFTDGITFTFPTGVNAVSMAPNETILVVPGDPAEFRAANGVPDNIRIFGSHNTALDNAGDSLELSKPGPAEQDGTVPLILVDRVNYNNVLPWPLEAAGGGAALQRRVADAYGNDSANWAASGDGGTPGIVPPQVTGVFVSGSDWSEEFLDHLAAAGLGGAGYAIPTGVGQFDALPWIGIDQVSIRFSRDMTVTLADLALWGAGTQKFPLVDFAYDDANFIATWTLENPLRADALLIDLSSEVHDVGGRRLDADWLDGSSTFPSGNDFVEGDERFRFRINVLPGDVDAGARVDRADLVDLIHHLGSDAGEAAFDFARDLTGDARVDLRDLRALLLRLHTRLPTAEPSPGGASPPLVAVDTVFARLGALSPGPAAVADKQPSRAIDPPRSSTAEDSDLLGEISRRSRRHLATRRVQTVQQGNDLRPPTLEMRRTNRR